MARARRDAVYEVTSCSLAQRLINWVTDNLGYQTKLNSAWGRLCRSMLTGTACRKCTQEEIAFRFDEELCSSYQYLQNHLVVCACFEYDRNGSDRAYIV